VTRRKPSRLTTGRLQLLRLFSTLLPIRLKTHSRGDCSPQLHVHTHPITRSRGNSRNDQVMGTHTRQRQVYDTSTVQVANHDVPLLCEVRAARLPFVI